MTATHVANHTASDIRAGTFTSNFYREGLNSHIPQYMHESIERYLEHGIFPGAFLQAIFSNDFQRALTFADRTNRDALHDYALFLTNFAPDGCHGSRKAMLAWYRRGGLQRTKLFPRRI